MYKLLQNQAVSNFHNEINDLGWAKVCEEYPAVEAHMACSMGGSQGYVSDFLVHYVHVADVDANTVEDAFHMHNNPFGDPVLEQQITRYGRQHSMSVGDILVAEDGGLYMCDPAGFSFIGFGDSYTKAARAEV